MKDRMFDGGLLETSEPCVIGIDPSLTGFAVTALSTQSRRYITWVYRSDLRGVERLRDIDRWLEARMWHLLRSRQVLDVAIEGGVVQSHSAFVLGELAGVVKVRLFRLPLANGRFPVQVPPMSLKKFVAGKGTGVKKNEMLLKTYRKWGVEFTDDNAADSYGLAQVVRYMVLPPMDVLAYETEVLEKLKDPKFRDTPRRDAA